MKETWPKKVSLGHLCPDFKSPIEPGAIPRFQCSDSLMKDSVQEREIETRKERKEEGEEVEEVEEGEEGEEREEREEGEGGEGGRKGRRRRTFHWLQDGSKCKSFGYCWYSFQESLGTPRDGRSLAGSRLLLLGTRSLLSLHSIVWGFVGQ